MTPDNVRQEIELAVVELLKKQLADGTITEARSQQISQIVLELLRPGMNWENLYAAIFKLDDSCNELSEVVLPYAREYEKNITKKATDVVQNYIRVGKYDAAVKLAQDTISQKVKLQWQGSAKAQ